ncbi:hypothetical protein AH547_09810 [Salmonella enterica subsp. enterica]|nr:hypothetical protein [Salmonella enterica subsp. enterica serovar Javiana]ECH9478888.1 hypothetical protein [Salmonella enterica subsp. enterica]
MKAISYLAALLIRSLSRLVSLSVSGLVLGVVGVMGILGFIMLAPFPSFWRELTAKGAGYETK